MRLAQLVDIENRERTRDRLIERRSVKKRYATFDGEKLVEAFTVNIPWKPGNDLVNDDYDPADHSGIFEAVPYREN